MVVKLNNGAVREIKKAEPIVEKDLHLMEIHCVW